MRCLHTHPPRPPTATKGSAGSSPSSEDVSARSRSASPTCGTAYRPQLHRHTPHQDQQGRPPHSHSQSHTHGHGQTSECIYKPSIAVYAISCTDSYIWRLRPVRAVPHVTDQIDTMHAEGGRSVMDRGTHRGDSVLFSSFFLSFLTFSCFLLSFTYSRHRMINTTVHDSFPSPLPSNRITKTIFVSIVYCPFGRPLSMFSWYVLCTYAGIIPSRPRQLSSRRPMFVFVYTRPRSCRVMSCHDWIRQRRSRIRRVVPLSMFLLVRGHHD
ncbi:hypothetical protein HD554DRAFT_1235926 [Boletus coccyginus]|nr:hypothetical protein HD554DRAFT_1235926 [Boletus coccyginus]